MLVHSKEDRIRILPAIPDSWKDLEFKNLKIPPGILVSLKMNDGKIKNIKLKNDTLQKIKICVDIPPEYLNEDIKRKVSKDIILKSHERIFLR